MRLYSEAAQDAKTQSLLQRAEQTDTGHALYPAQEARGPRLAFTSAAAR